MSSSLLTTLEVTVIQDPRRTRERGWHSNTDSLNEWLWPTSDTRTRIITFVTIDYSSRTSHRYLGSRLRVRAYLPWYRDPSTTITVTTDPTSMGTTQPLQYDIHPRTFRQSLDPWSRTRTYLDVTEVPVPLQNERYHRLHRRPHSVSLRNRDPGSHTRSNDMSTETKHWTPTYVVSEPRTQVTRPRITVDLTIDITSVCVSLKPRPRTPHFIEKYRYRGYRFHTVHVTSVSLTQTSHPWTSHRYRVPNPRTYPNPLHRRGRDLTVWPLTKNSSSSHVDKEGKTQRVTLPVTNGLTGFYDHKRHLAQWPLGITKDDTPTRVIGDRK